MSPEGAAEESRKRKRAQKSKQGPASSRKRRRADEDEVMAEESGEDVGAGERENSSTTNEANGVAGNDKSNKTPQKPAASPTVTPKSSKSAKQAGISAGALSGETTITRSVKEDRGNIRNNAVSKGKYKGWSVSSPIGGRYLSLDPQFTSDGKYLVAAKEHEVRLLSIEDSLVQETIAAPESSAVTGFAVSPAEPSRIYVGFSNPSRIEQWDWLNTSTPAGSTTIDDNIVRVAATVSEQAGEETVYTLADGATGSHIFRNGKPVFQCKSRMIDMAVFDNTCICIGSGKLVLGTLREDGGQEVVFDLNFKATSLAVRQHLSRLGQQKKGISFDLAIGASTGEVFVYENIALDVTGAAKGALPTPRTLHWHRNAVHSVKWSRDGAYLISGGRETVLVIWQLSTGKKQFLPHMSAEIEHVTISPSGTSYALQLADNSIMVLSTSELKPVAHFPDIQNQLPSKSPTYKESTSVLSYDLPLEQLRTAGLIHPVERDSLLLTVPSSVSTASSATTRPFLQSFSISAQRHEYRQALTRNSLTDLNTGPNGAPIQSPDVSHIALSPDGKVMATVESWNPLPKDYAFLAHDEKLDDEATSSRREVYLKFWNWDNNNTRWSLETRISNPHSLSTAAAGLVHHLIADPTGPRFFTLGADSTIRLWGHKSSDWLCRNSFTLPLSTDVTPASSFTPPMPPQIGCIAISADASLLACSLPPSSAFCTITQIHLISITGGSASSKLEPTHILAPIRGNAHSLAFRDRQLIVLTTLNLTVIDIPTLAPIATHILHAPKDKVPLAYRQRHLAVASSGMAAIAVPTLWREKDPASTAPGSDQRVAQPWTKIEVYNTAVASEQGKGRVFETKIRGIVMGFYARGTDWVAATADGRIFTIAPPAEGKNVLERIKAKEGVLQNGEDEVERGVVEAEEPSLPLVPSNGALDTEQPDDQMEVDGDQEGDKPVVRPEELARVFESRAGVRDMFDGVMGLFARRPVRVV